MPTQEDILSGYGMERVADVRIIDNQFIIDVVNPEAGSFEKCIYAFVVGDEIMRIGSSKGKLKARLRAWQNDVSNSLSGKSFRTPKTEAAIWSSALALHGSGKLFARLGTIVQTPVGEMNLFLTEESILIARHSPRCCNDVDRHRRIHGL